MRKLHSNPVGWSEIRGNVQSSFTEALWMDGCRRRQLVSGLCCLLSRPEMGQQQARHKCMLLWPQCCTDGPGDPEWPVASSCCLCPRREQLLRQLLAWGVGLILDVLLVCWCQLYLPGLLGGAQVCSDQCCGLRLPSGRLPSNPEAQAVLLSPSLALL